MDLEGLSYIADPGHFYQRSRWEQFKKECPTGITSDYKTGKKYKIIDFRPVRKGEMYVGYLHPYHGKMEFMVDSASINGTSLVLIIEPADVEYDYVTDGVPRVPTREDWVWSIGFGKGQWVKPKNPDYYGCTLCYRRVERKPTT